MHGIIDTVLEQARCKAVLHLNCCHAMAWPRMNLLLQGAGYLALGTIIAPGCWSRGQGVPCVVVVCAADG
jgi:hypothetical protein